MKVSGANGIITIARSAFTIISNKVVANIVGPAGVAFVGQLQNFITISTLLSSGGFSSGLTKYIAEKNNDKKSIYEFVSTAFVFSTIFSSLLSIVLLLFSGYLTKFIFSSDKYLSIIVILALTLLSFNINTLILSVVNGFQYYKKYFLINITTTLVGFSLTIFLVIYFKVYGVLLAIVLSQTIVSLFSYYYVRNEDWIKSISLKLFSKEKLSLLLKYSSITILAAVIWPTIDMIIRTYVFKYISANEAGIWQATKVINEYIVNLAVGSFSIYLLPRLASINTKKELKNELLYIYKIIIPISIVGFCVFYLLRNYAILFLYSSSFLKVGDYLLLQMLGSFFWMCRIPLMNYMLAKTHTKTYFVFEIIFASIFVSLVIILIPILKVQGIQLSFAIYNFIYLLVVLIFVAKKTNSK